MWKFLFISHGCSCLAEYLRRHISLQRPAFACGFGIYADALFLIDILGSLKGGLKHYFVVHLFKQYAARALEA